MSTFDLFFRCRKVAIIYKCHVDLESSKQKKFTHVFSQSMVDY